MSMAKVFALGRLSTVVLRQRRARLLRELRLPPELMRASVVERFTTCGSPNCSCARGERHGPYYYLTQCLAPGRMQKFQLKTDAALARARQATTAFKDYYDHLEELSQLNTELFRRGEPLPDPP